MNLANLKERAPIETPARRRSLALGAIATLASLATPWAVAPAYAQPGPDGGPPPLGNNVCVVTGNVTVTGPGYPTATPVQFNVTYSEPNPFLNPQPTPFTMTLGMTPPPDPAATIPPWLYGPVSHHMGINEGPNTVSQVGDGGSIRIELGPCGTLSDTFNVTAVPPGADYSITHTISGNLNLSSFANLAQGAVLARDVSTKFSPFGSSGTIMLSEFATKRVLCAGEFTVEYTSQHAAVSLPVEYQSHLEFNGTDPLGNLIGTRTRVQATIVPAAPPAVYLLLGAGLLMLGSLFEWRRRQVPRDTAVT